MKKLLIVFVLASITTSAMAQKTHFRGRGYYTVRPRVVIGIGGGFGYSPFYNPYYYPYGGYSARPSRLNLEIQDIQIDYADRIKSVRMDKSVPGKERRQRIRELKYQRDKAIVDAKRDYYYRRQSER